jgi:L-ascorbate metabolism protein UlaG (beta-lactamase superfamily)
MVITYHGGECFKVSFGSTTLVFNPISKKSKLPPTRFGADVVFITMNHPDMNGAEEMAYGAKQPLVVDGPGEYEIGEVTARGYGVFLGALGSEAIDPHILSELGSIDILFVPIGGGDVIDVPAASKLATKLEARCIIPMHGNDTAIKAFLKEEGAESVKPVEKLTVKKKDLLEMESEIVIIKS